MASTVADSVQTLNTPSAYDARSVSGSVARIVYVTANPHTMEGLLEGQLKHLSQLGYEVIAVTAGGQYLETVKNREGVRTEPFPILREIRPFRDLLAVFRMARLLRRLRPDIVNASNLKGGLIGMAGAWLARVPIRVYLLRGLTLERQRGFKRLLFQIAERVTSACATRVVCVSESVRQSYLSLGCTRREKTVVLASGSSGGIRAERFQQTAQTRHAAAQLRQTWGVSPETPIVGFVGRFTRDKGLFDLLDAFDDVTRSHPDAWLLLVGDYDIIDRVPPDTVRRIAEHPRIIRPGFVDDVAPYYAAMNVLAFPSYREGFPNTVLETAVAEVPTVGFRVTGVVDAIQDGVTGTIVAPGDAKALAAAVLKYLSDPELRRRHAQAAHDRVLREFDRDVVWQAWHDEYTRLLQEAGHSNPTR